MLTGTSGGQHQTQAIALTACAIWFLPKERLRKLLQNDTELEHLFNNLLAQDLNTFSHRIA